MIELGKVHVGNCIDLMKSMPDGCIDLVVSSPPYPGAKMWDALGLDVEKLNYDSLTECYRLLKPHGVIAWQIGDIPYGDHGALKLNAANSMIHAVNNLGMKMRCQVIWDKCAPHLPPLCFMRRPAVTALSHEYVLIFFKDKWVPQEKESGLGTDKGYMTQSVWRIPPDTGAHGGGRAEGHIAPYPYELARRIIQLWSIPGNVVLDPFMGSGTTALAAERLERQWIGMEYSEEYAKIAEKRIDDERRQYKLF